MGKIFMIFRVSHTLGFVAGDAGVPFKELQQMINSLPGETRITNIEDMPTISLSKVYKVEAENDDFADGTEIEGNWKRHVIPINGFLKQFNTFQGITIIDPPGGATVGNAHNHNTSLGPPTPSQPAHPSPNSYNPTATGYTLPTAASATYKYKVTYGSVPITSYGITDVPVTISIKNPGVKDKCTCGADKVAGLHSNWCDKASLV